MVTDDGLYNYIVKYFFYLSFENCGTNSILASHDHNRLFIGIFEIILNFMIIDMAQPKHLVVYGISSANLRTTC